MFTAIRYIGISIFCIGIAAQTGVFAGRLNVKRQQQEMSQWCWAASSSMVLSHYKIIKSQSDIVKMIKGSVVNQAGSGTDMVNALSRNGLPATSKGVITEAELKRYADSGKPFTLGWMWISGGGHALVYDGYVESQYYIIDPWQNNGTNAYSYNAVKNAGGKGKWSLSVIPARGNTGTANPAVTKNMDDIHLSSVPMHGSLCFLINNLKKITGGSITIYTASGKSVAVIPLEQNRCKYLWNFSAGEKTVLSGIYFAAATLTYGNGDTRHCSLKVTVVR